MASPLHTLVMREPEIVREGQTREDNTPPPTLLSQTPTPPATTFLPPESFFTVPDHMEGEGVTEGGLLYLDTSASALHVLVHHLPQSSQSPGSQEESSGHLPTQINYFQEGVFKKLVKEDESQEQFVVVGALKNDNLTTSPSLPAPCNLSVENILTGYGEVSEEADDTETTMILDSVPHITLEEIIQKFASSPTTSPFENSLETPTAITTITQPLQPPPPPSPPPPPPPPPETSKVRVKILGEIREGEGLLGDDGCLYDEVVTYRCRLCGNVFEEKEDLLKHHKQNHKQTQGDVVKIKITTSNTTTTTTSQLRLDKEHTKESRINCCSFCSMDFHNLIECQEHMKKAHPDRKGEGVRKQYQSQGTPVHYPTQPGMLIGHRKSRSSSTTSTTCSLPQVDGMDVDGNDCDNDNADKGKRKVKTPRLLQEQYWLHKQKPKPVCLVQVEKTFRCSRSNCKYKFSSEANLQSHLDCHGGGNEGGEERGFTCSHCSSKYEKWPLCQLHLWKAHGVDIDLLTCGICQTYKTCTQQQLLVHQQIHSDLKEHVCKTCDKRFKQLAQLLNHQVTHITDVKDLPAWAERSYCEECQRWFKDSRALRKHINLIHLKRKPYSCPHCPYRCSRKNDLKVHTRQHTDERPHQCPLCGWQARDHNVMRKHKLAHQDIRPFRCPATHCQFKNRNPTYFKRHMARLHPKNEAIFKCQFCPVQTVNIQEYISHSRNHEKFLVEEAMKRRRQDITVTDSVETDDGGQAVTNKETIKPIPPILTNTTATTTPTSTVTLHNLEDMNQRMEFVTIKFDNGEEEKVSNSINAGSFGGDSGCSGVSLPQVVVNNGQYILHLPQDLSTITTSSPQHEYSTSLPPPVITSSQLLHIT